MAIRMRRVHRFEAEDGQSFPTAKECREHENKDRLTRLVNMTSADVMAAVEGTDLEIAEAIEFAGQLIAKKRRERGDLRRAPKTKTGKTAIEQLKALKALKAAGTVALRESKA
jgi:hypothetical protein